MVFADLPYSYRGWKRTLGREENVIRERGGKDYPWWVLPEGYERGLLLLMQASHWKLLRIGEKGGVCEELLQFGQSGDHNRRRQGAKTVFFFFFLKKIVESPRTSHGWKSWLSLIGSVHVWFSTHTGYITRDNQQKGDKSSRMVRKCHFPFPSL